MRIIHDNVLVSITGLPSVEIYVGHKSKMLWNGFADAYQAFTDVPTMPTSREIEIASEKWLSTLQEKLDSGLVHPPLPGTGQFLTSLQVFAMTSDHGLSGFTARLVNNSGKLVPQVGELRRAGPTETRFVPFGSCAEGFSSDVSKSNLLPNELAHYERLFGSTATMRSKEQLNDLALAFERLATAASRRQASVKGFQDVGEPFDLAEFDLFSSKWTIQRVER